MLVKEQDKSTSKIKQVVGAPISIQHRKGSTNFFLRYFHHKINGSPKVEWHKNGKVNLQVFEKGIALHYAKETTRETLFLPYHDITDLSFTPGLENIRFCKISIFKLAVKLGIPIRYARYLATFQEYQIAPCRLSINTKEYQLTMEANGYQYHRHAAFFEGIREKSSC